MARTSTLDPVRSIKTPKKGVAATLSPVAKGVRQHLNTSSAATAALVDPNKPLTTQQLAFAQAWARGESIYSAGQRAGYTENDTSCYRMARMPNILRVYEREKRLFEEAAQMSRKKVMDMHLDAFAMAKLMAEPASMVSAAREIGRMCGYYEPVKHTLDITVQGEVTVRQLNQMSDSELVRMLTGDTPLLPSPDQGTPDAPL